MARALPSSQRGNALFLILIAVILFAALSYAITQSNRSGGDSSRESNLIASTTVTEYPNAVITGINRLLLHGAAITDLDYTPPSDATFNNAPVTYKVFHPQGGGVAWQNVDPNTVTLDANGVPEGAWVFVQNKIVNGIGTGLPEQIAVLTHVRKGICEQIDKELIGTTTIPVLTIDEGNLTTPGMDNLDDAVIASDPPPGGLLGYHALCVKTISDSRYEYYHVLVEQ